MTYATQHGVTGADFRTVAGQAIARKARHLTRTSGDPLAGLAYVNMQIGGYGVEYIAHRDDTDGRRHGLEYVNLGDTYRPTVIYDWRAGRFLWGVSWGDIVERSPEGRYQ